MSIIVKSPPKKKRQPKQVPIERPPEQSTGCSRIIGGILVFGLVLSVYLLSKPPNQPPKYPPESPTQQTIDFTQPKKNNTLLFEDVIQKNHDGTVDLQPKRKAKLHRDTSNLKGAEQYVLLAKKNRFYPCLSCPFRDSIFLYYGEIWKYGITINGEKGRYGNSLYDKDLDYLVQFRGRIDECLIQERIKIIRYPMLPENLKRKYPIARPPGNPNDN